MCVCAVCFDFVDYLCTSLSWPLSILSFSLSLSPLSLSHTVQNQHASELHSIGKQTLGELGLATPSTVYSVPIEASTSEAFKMIRDKVCDRRVCARVCLYIYIYPFLLLYVHIYISFSSSSFFFVQIKIMLAPISNRSVFILHR